MAIPITIPRLGWNMDEGVFVGWLKGDGATVRAGEALFSVEGDKATQDVECLDDGVLRIPPDGPKPGDKLLVGAVIGYLVQPGEAAPWDCQAPGAVDASVGKSPSPDRSAGPEIPAIGRISPDEMRHAGRRIAISPRAARVAAELGVDCTKILGSGRTGRIREEDIRAAAENRIDNEPPPPLAKTSIPTTSIRQTIAERMLASHQSTAPVTLTTTADATELVNRRNQFKAAARNAGDAVPSYTVLLVKLAATALREHPLLNASWTDNRIVAHEAIHIGIAVDTPAGLLVPVIRDVPSLSPEELTARSRDLIDRAQQRKLSADELQGGTFTVTNLGMFGVDAFTPIINAPQCAVLGIGRIERRPAVVADTIVARDEITLSLTFDHRIVDGAPAARFLQTLVNLIEHRQPKE